MTLVTDEVSIECVIAIAREASKIAMEGFNKVKKIDTKVSVADLVTEYDVATEDFIKQEVLKRFPHHAFLAEETSSNDSILTSLPTWIIDPIDGTANFIHGIPLFCVSIGFARSNEIIHGVVFNPSTEELWHATRGCGAWYSIGQAPPVRISTSTRIQLGSSIISTGFGVYYLRSGFAIPEVDTLKSVMMRNHETLITKSRDIRRFGSAALDLCFVAMGRTDTFFEFGTREWDIAAGLVILDEAGGSVSSVGGSKLDIHARNILACASVALREELVSVLVDVDMLQVTDAIASFKQKSTF